MSSCVLNNGFTTDLLQVRCGVRQGDPLSPLLFILALEVVACQIREDNEIRGILVNEQEIKFTLFANDMSCFLKDIASYHRLVVTLQLFSRFSNLHVNNEKTEIFAIGRHRLDQINLPHKIRTSIKIWGIIFDYNTSSRMKANFDSILKSIKDILNMWKWRGLTLLGKIQIVKSFIIPKVLKNLTHPVCNARFYYCYHPGHRCILPIFAYSVHCPSAHEDHRYGGKDATGSER